MKKQGFVFLDIIIGIFLIGLMSTVLIPIFASNQKNLSRIKINEEMVYLGESIFEKFYSKDEYAMELLMKLEEELSYMDLDFKYLDKYNCKLLNLGIEENLWNLKVVIELKNNGGKIPNVEFIGTIPKKGQQ